MQEFSFLIDGAFERGLSSDGRARPNSEVLDVCDHMRPTPRGLEDFQAITSPASNFGLSVAWPFPQLFRGKSVTLLADATTIYVIDESDWSKAAITTYDAYAPDTTKAITTGGAWQFMDFGPTWMLFNDVVQVYKTGHSSKYFVQDKATVRTGCEYKGARAFFGGFDTGNFWNKVWQNFWDSLTANSPTETAGLLNTAIGLDTNWVWWGNIGGGDLLFMFTPEYLLGDFIRNGVFDGNALNWVLGSGWAYTSNTIAKTPGASVTASQPMSDMFQQIQPLTKYTLTFDMTGWTAGTVELFFGTLAPSVATVSGNQTHTIIATSASAAVLGATPGLAFLASTDFDGAIGNVSLVETDVRPRVHDLLQRNEMGGIMLPWQGRIYRQQQLGDAVICYGDAGVSALVPFSGSFPGMAPRPLAGLGENIGIASRGAAGGHDGQHVFVDSTGELWAVSGDLKAQKLGYKHIFSAWLNDNIVISYEQSEREFWISNGTDAYVLGINGLSKAPQIPTSIVFAKGLATGVVTNAAQNTTLTVRSWRFNLGERGGKHITGVQIFSEGITNMKVAVYYRYKNTDAFKKTATVPVNPSGYAKLVCSSPDAKVEVTGTIVSDQAQISQIEVRYQKEDRRYVRGTQAAQATG